MGEKILGTLIIVAGMTFLFAGDSKRIPADMVLNNGKIYTADSRNTFVEGLAVKGGKILALGNKSELKSYIGPETQIIDLKGHLVLPGFIDAHCHFSQGGHSLLTLNFRGVDSISKIKEMIKDRIQEIPEGAPVFGSQYDHTLFPEGNWPSREDLDPVSPKNPVVIRRVDGHSIWVNSLALKLSQINKDTPSPFGGEIVKNAVTGEPTGILKESATELIKVKPDQIVSTPREDIERALKHAAELGLTGIHTGSNLEELKIYQNLKDKGLLTLRVYAWLPVEELDECMKMGIRQGQGDDWVKVGFIKMFIDGTLGSGTALLFKPFSDNPSSSGLAQYKEDEFNRLVEKAHKNGYQIGVHAIGNKGVHWVLNAVERSQKMYGEKKLRHRIEHAQIIIPEDIKRFSQLGVVASMQPTHCTTDLRFCERRIGHERSKGAYIWKSLLERRTHLAFGTDWPVEPLDPMRGLYSAVTRKNIESDSPEGGWFPEEKLSLEEAIQCYTAGSAYASFEEEKKGTLETGKLADMIVLSQDIFQIPARKILITRILMTIVGGKIIFQNDQVSFQ